VNHGALQSPDGSYRFFWFGQERTLDGFNESLFEFTKCKAEEVAAFASGMHLSASLDAAQRTLGALDALEEVVKLPLCDRCRALIGEKADS